MKRILAVVLAFMVMVAAVILVRAATFPSRQITAPAAELIAVDQTRIAQNLSRAIQCKTISYQDPAQFPAPEFKAFRDLLEAAYPAVHAALGREIINEHSLLYTWPGTDPTLSPILFIAHYDVVPVEPGTEDDWTHPAFAGEIADGFVWGRGSIDFKSGVTGILEAAEALLQQGFHPKRTLLFAFGHDEELGGDKGAANIAALLQDRGLRAYFSLDEGMAIVQGVVPGVAGPLGLIGLAEKGYVSLELVAEGQGGHSSNPPPQTTIGIVAAALAKLEAHPMPARLEGPIRMMLEYAGPHMAFPMRMVMANLWLFERVVMRVLAADPAPNAAIRTTTAATIFQAGSKENVLPIQARAVVNFRILPGDSVQGVINHVTDTVDDERVTVRVLPGGESTEPSPVSDVHAEGYRHLAASVRQVRPEVIVAPGLTLGGTDSKNYVNVCDNLYRIQPMLVSTDDLARIHGTNERLEIDNYARAIQTYAQVMRNGGG
jgi:carboxypeptidase PM20D1